MDADKNAMIFKNKQELLQQFAQDDACEEDYSWAAAQETLEDILENCPLPRRIWAIGKGYSQFAEHCPWSQLDGRCWAWLLRWEPQFAERCPWSQFLLDGDDWVLLLSGSPQFADRCTQCGGWSQLDGYHWACLLRAQPQLAEHCTQCGGWVQLSEQAWCFLLSVQPQFKEYCPARYAAIAREATGGDLMRRTTATYHVFDCV